MVTKSYLPSYLYASSDGSDSSDSSDSCDTSDQKTLFTKKIFHAKKKNKKLKLKLNIFKIGCTNNCLSPRKNHQTYFFHQKNLSHQKLFSPNKLMHQNIVLKQSFFFTKTSNSYCDRTPNSKILIATNYKN